MKKIYSLLLILMFGSSVFAQVPTCSMNPTYLAIPKAGVFPDSVTNFVSGTVGVPYRQDITVKVPDDTTALGITFCFSRFELKTSSNPVTVNYGLPPGLSLSGPATATAGVFSFPAAANDCAVIYGTPTTAGSYTLHLQVDPYGAIKNPFGSCPSPIVPSSGSLSPNGPIFLNYYIINIAPAVGVNEYHKDGIGLLQNQPNPFSGKTTVKYYVESEDNATLSVYNALGSLVYSAVSKTQVGENKFEINAENWTNGVYFYSVKFKNSVSTKRLMVNN